RLEDDAHSPSTQLAQELELTQPMSTPDRTGGGDFASRRISARIRSPVRELSQGRQEPPQGRRLPGMARGQVVDVDRLARLKAPPRLLDRLGEDRVDWVLQRHARCQ